MPSIKVSSLFIWLEISPLSLKLNLFIFTGAVQPITIYKIRFLNKKASPIPMLWGCWLQPIQYKPILAPYSHFMQDLISLSKALKKGELWLSRACNI